MTLLMPGNGENMPRDEQIVYASSTETRRFYDAKFVVVDVISIGGVNDLAPNRCQLSHYLNQCW